MGLLWFMLLVGLTGMAVDVTNGFRNRTMLQATADSAVLAAVIDLPNGATAAASAVAYSDGNMPGAMYGDVLKAADVEIGSWDNATRSFTAGGVVENVLDPGGALIPDAVRVTLHQTAANTNAVPVNFLRIVGLQTWDVNVQAVAQRFLPDCLMDGLIAAGVVDISSNNGFVNEICIHGQTGVMIQNHNYHELGVIVSMPDMDTQLVLPSGTIGDNPGLQEALREQSLLPRMVNHVNDIMLDMLALQSNVMPGYVSVPSPPPPPPPTPCCRSWRRPCTTCRRGNTKVRKLAYGPTTSPTSKPGASITSNARRGCRTSRKPTSPTARS
jgi:hypothetical protein